MVEHRKASLNRLLSELPEGLLISASGLQARGYSRSLVAHYVKRGWLESPARGVYLRPGAPLRWQQVVASLLHVQRVPVHVGGLSALEQQGAGHFVRLAGESVIHLYLDGRAPDWVAKLDLAPPFALHGDSLFALPTPSLDEQEPALSLLREPATYQSPALATVAAAKELMLIPWGQWEWPLLYATPERAFLELLEEVPVHVDVHHADLILEGLAGLSPRRLMRLLRACNSVKVKRLFLALAERHAHPWFEKLDLDAIDLGRGKRMLIPGGRLHPRFKITLPNDLYGPGG